MQIDAPKRRASTFCRVGVSLCYFKIELFTVRAIILLYDKQLCSWNRSGCYREHNDYALDSKRYQVHARL